MSKGRYGVHGGQYIPETLMNEIINLENAYEHYKNDPEFVIPNLIHFLGSMQTDLHFFIMPKDTPLKIWAVQKSI